MPGYRVDFRFPAGQTWYRMLASKPVIAAVLLLSAVPALSRLYQITGERLEIFHSLPRRANLRVK